MEFGKHIVRARCVASLKWFFFHWLCRSHRNEPMGPGVFQIICCVRAYINCIVCAQFSSQPQGARARAAGCVFNALQAYHHLHLAHTEAAWSDGSGFMVDRQSAGWLHRSLTDGPAETKARGSHRHRQNQLPLAAAGIICGVISRVFAAAHIPEILLNIWAR